MTTFTMLMSCSEVFGGSLCHIHECVLMNVFVVYFLLYGLIMFLVGNIYVSAEEVVHGVW